MPRLSAKAVYYVISAITALFQNMIFTALAVYYVQQVNLNPLQLVLVGTALELTIFLFEIPTGVVADSYSRRLSAIIGPALWGVGFMLEGFVPLFGAVIAAQVICGLGYTFVSGALSAWITDEVGETEVGRVFVRASQIGQITGIVGVIAGAGLATLQLNLPIWLGGLGLIGLSIFMVIAMPETGFHPVPREDRNNWQVMGHTLRQGVKVMRTRPLALTIIAVGFIFGAYSEGFDRLWEAHFIRDLSVPFFSPVIWFAIIGLAGRVLNFVVLAIVIKRIDLSQSRAVVRTLMIIQALLSVSILAFALVTNFYLAVVALWAISIFRNINHPIGDTWLNQNLDSKVRATVLSMYSQVDALGQFVCGPLLGLIGTLVSIPAALATSALILSISVLFYGQALRYTGKVTETKAVVNPAE